MSRCAAILGFLLAAGNLAAQQSLHMAIGDPARKNKEAKLVLDAVTDTATGDVLTPRELVQRLAGTRLVFIGESHTSIDFHRAQKKVIEELLASGKKVFIGLEMYPHPEQGHLDDWSNGYLTEAGFIQLSHWYQNWGYNWNYYRDIFLLAREHNLRMFALNAPREIVSAVSRKGLDKLSNEERAFLAPKIDTSSEEHFELFKAFFAEETGMHAKMSDAMARAMYAAQCTWDATMGYFAAQMLKRLGDENTVMVVLIGSGHVAYNLGILRQAAQWYDGKMASIIPIEVRDDKQRPITAVQASYADYIWGLPPETDTLYPDMGIATGEADGGALRKVLSLDDGSPAKAAGFQLGDVILSVDGTPMPDGEVLNRYLAGKAWGDGAAVVVRRQTGSGGPQEVTLQVYFRRHLNTDKSR